MGEVDAEMAALLAEEQARQTRGLELIASENFTTRAVREVRERALLHFWTDFQW